MIYEVEGDLLTQEYTKYICHQTNCYMHNYNAASGLAYFVGKKWPFAHPYKNKKNITTLGTVNFVNVGEKIVVEMDAQFYPGPPSESGEDTAKERMNAFRRCLEKIKDAGVKTLAFPKYIGCGLAAGDWALYRQMLEDAFCGEDFQCYIVELKK